MTELDTADAESARSQHLPARGWPAVAVAAVGTFTVVTSEMLPVGLLTPMSDALRVSGDWPGWR